MIDLVVMVVTIFVTPGSVAVINKRSRGTWTRN